MLGGALAIGLVGATVALTTGAAPVLVRARRSAAWTESGLLLMGIFVADIGAWVFANGIADWQATAYLADPVRSGDSIGLLPLEFAIFATIAGAALLSSALLMAAKLRLSWQPSVIH